MVQRAANCLRAEGHDRLGGLLPDLLVAAVQLRQPELDRGLLGRRPSRIKPGPNRTHKLITPMSAARNNASTSKDHTSGPTAGRDTVGGGDSSLGRIDDWLTDSLEELSSPQGGWADQRFADASGGPSYQRSLSPPEFCRGGGGMMLPATGGSIALPQLGHTQDESPRRATSALCTPQYGHRMAGMSQHLFLHVTSARYFCTRNLWTVECLKVSPGLTPLWGNLSGSANRGSADTPGRRRRTWRRTCRRR